MNQDFPFLNDDFEELRDLLQQFENLKAGQSHSFLDEDSFELIIDYYDEHDELPNAMQAAEMAIEQFPYSSTLLLKKANLLIESKKYQEAMDLLEKAAILDSTDINLYILQTDVYLAMNQHEKAAAVLEEQIAVFEGEDKTELLLELADVYDDCEEFEKVFDCLRLTLEHDPNNEEALHKICFWTEFTGRNEESIRLHTNIINEHPYNQLAWFNLGTAYQGLKLYEKAIDAYQYAIVIDEKFDYAYRNMGDAYIRLRKYGEAIDVLKKHLEIAKPEDVIYEAIGHCYERQRKYTQARYYYRKASHLSPSDDKLYYKIGIAYMTEANWENAIKSIMSAIKINKNSAEYLIALGQCYLELDKNKEGLIHLLAAVRIRPSSITTWQEFIRGLYVSGFFEEALSQLEAATQKVGHKPVLQYYRAAIMFATGKSKEGMLQLETALQVNAKHVKKLIELDPTLLQHPGIVELITRYKRTKKGK
ncbi:tetratricopeptide repeat protein [Chitinophaga sp. CF418]|uniref:tetratricopeptide repeat protein n=1 Tax=Chitinophaga sp. CF418 TaxID=1855287 RepID=UPI00091D40CC|nr:tetratricopeptide repeat protein [Chitinophaga sp. CF418]SHM97037.1 Tetratricopeptide repeat-containing protein [Chitinophaga sp. CF418]